MPRRVAFRIAILVLASAGYVALCHWLMTRAPASPWNAVGVLAPMVAAIAIGAWRAGQRTLGVAAGLVLAGLGSQALLGWQVSPQGLYLAQHAGINVFLAIAFGSTLRPGRTSLITTLAARVHRRFTPEMAVYTRKVTLAWTLYFIGMAFVSLALYTFAGFATWALFANLITPLAVALMFGAEYALRYRLHPEFERASVADAIRSYLRGADATTAPLHPDPVARERPQADDLRRPPPEGDEQSGRATLAHERPQADEIRRPPPEGDEQSGRATLAHERRDAIA